MSAKTTVGVLVTGLVLFVFGFAYWAVNPLPYSAWNEVSDIAAAQSGAAALFPEDGIYFLPGRGNDPAVQQFMDTGPSVYLTIDHTPTSGADPVAMGLGFVHNVLSALLIVLLLRSVSGLGPRVGAGALVGVVAAFVINGSEVIWWQQPFSWIVHQMIYYVLYFAIGAAVLGFFTAEAAEAKA